jgi:hypothetical protein
MKRLAENSKGWNAINAINASIPPKRAFSGGFLVCAGMPEHTTVPL